MCHTACEQDQDGTAVPSWSCSQAVSKPLWHIPFLRVQWKTPVDRQRNCPKHVEFYSKNKFEKLVNLVGFVIRIYHDARSPERQIIFLILSYPYLCTDVTILRSNHTNALCMLPPLYSHCYTPIVCSVIGYLHLDTQFVDSAHKIYQYSLRMAP